MLRPEPNGGGRGGAPRILFVQYTNPGAYPPIEHACRLLAGRGWSVRVLGTEVPGVETLRLRSTPGVEVRRLGGCSRGWRQKLHYAGFMTWVRGHAALFRPHWVYASDPLVTPAVALSLARRGTGLLYHEHDSPPEPWPPADAGPVIRLVARSRVAVARRAALCVLPNERRAARFQETLGPVGPVVTVWNCPARDEIGPARAPLRNGGLRVLYHGSIVPARLPPTVLEALARTPTAIRLTVVGYEPAGARGYVERLRALADRLGLADRVEFQGPVDRATLLRDCPRHDVGLALVPLDTGDPNERALAGASNKVFDYLAGGLAVLVADRPEWRAHVVGPGHGLACDPGDAASLAAALCWLAAHPDETRRMGERGRRRTLDDWNYERQFEPVLERLEAAVTDAALGASR